MTIRGLAWCDPDSHPDSSVERDTDNDSIADEVLPSVPWAQLKDLRVAVN